MEQLIISQSPHLHGKESTRAIMRDVLIALAPATILAIIFYGWPAITLLAVSVITCVATEFLAGKYLLKSGNSTGDLSAIVTAVILALNLPPAAPWWIAVVGGLFAIGVAKMSFGGLGQNIFNPAIVARVFLLISFPVAMTDWTLTEPLFSCQVPWIGAQIDAFSGATPLGTVSGIAADGTLNGLGLQQILEQGSYTWQKLLLIKLGGSMGEISSVALIAGFIYLLVRRVIKPTIPLVIIGTAALISLAFSAADPARFTGPLFNIFTGGLLIGAIFMATDYVTSPMSFKGQVIYSVGIGAIAMFIRYFGSYPEGVSFSILIMNCIVPLLNRYFKPRRFAGEVKNG